MQIELKSILQSRFLPRGAAISVAVSLFTACAASHRSAPAASREQPPAATRAADSSLLNDAAHGARTLGDLTWTTVTAPAALFKKNKPQPVAQTRPAAPPELLIVAPSDGGATPMLIPPAGNP
jgi:hypothetical protein